MPILRLGARAPLPLLVACLAASGCIQERPATAPPAALPAAPGAGSGARPPQPVQPRLAPVAAPAPAAAPASTAIPAVTDSAPVLSGDACRRAESLVSVFENGTRDIQYAYAEDIHDGRGITAGRCGFCTGTGDALLVVRRYAGVAPDAPIVRFLPELERLHTAQDAGDTRGLDGFIRAWRRCAKDPRFRSAQDAVYHELYFLPAMAQGRTLQLRTPLAAACILDAIIQHGEGDDADGLPAIIAAANRAAGGTPATGIAEERWLRAFLAARDAVLAHAHDAATRAAWAASRDRVKVLLSLVAQGEWQLAHPLHLDIGEVQADIP